MLQAVQVLKNTTRAEIKAELDKLFKFQHGTTLDDAVLEVLNDKDVFAFLAAFAPQNSGLPLGGFRYWDDITVEVLYGLALPAHHSPPRKTKLYHFSLVVGSSSDLRYSEKMPTAKFTPDNYPSAKTFAAQVNYALMHEGRWIDLSKIR